MRCYVLLQQVRFLSLSFGSLARPEYLAGHYFGMVKVFEITMFAFHLSALVGPTSESVRTGSAKKGHLAHGSGLDTNIRIFFEIFRHFREI